MKSQRGNIADRRSYGTYYTAKMKKILSMLGMPYGTEAEYNACADLIISLLDKEDQTGINGKYAIIAAYRAWRFHKVPHYFLADGILQFMLESTTEARPLCPEIENIFDRPEHQTAFIHFPANQNESSVAILRMSNGDIYSTNGRFVCMIPGRVVEEGVCDLWSKEQSSHPGFIIARVAVGLSMYLSAFPDSIMEAKNEDVYLRKNYIGPALMVRTTGIVEEDCANASSPHWRRGHYRSLHSDMYTKKKGQIVFVKGTFVKGKAYDVLANTPEQEATQ